MICHKIHEAFIAVTVARSDTVEVGIFNDQGEYGDAHIDAGHVPNNINVATMTDGVERIFKGCAPANFQNGINAVPRQLKRLCSSLRGGHVVY